ncbi:hypothetical protein UAJ10_14195 [Nitrospirillum sp. BR 11164]|uniref:hypothetical protein n=1 Tax=Nitrospirillum sp. BR 11164 TaxID=3104324 RepID=UPI002AFEE377|nr:hypothetical protein [Nitrospirillum sp. BR 11164]MEA1650157.1 hypothetical protein [Nitrospirillum sp. BR 11164]
METGINFATPPVKRPVAHIAAVRINPFVASLTSNGVFMRHYQLLAATFGLALLTAGCQTQSDTTQTANAAAPKAAAQQRCVNTGSRLAGNCNDVGHADPKDLLNRPSGTKVPGS